ncbi:MAG: HTTM domain-containing protein, partial [Myxococcota bacterium]
MIGRRFDAWWLRPAPALRLAIVRVAVGLYCTALLAIRGSHYAAVGRLPPTRFAPLGVVSFLDAPVAPWLATALVVAAGAGCIAFTLGYRYRVSGPVFAALVLWVTTYRNSWGHVSHVDNLVVLHVLLLALVPAADSLSLDAKRAPAREWSARYGWPLRLMAITTVLTYVLAGVAKLRFGGAAWLGGEAVRLQVAFDALRKSRFGVTPSGFAQTLLPHPWTFAPMAWATLALELGAPLALLGRRAAAVWAVAMWLLHIGIALVMTLAFAYPLSLIAFAPLFRLER